MNPQPTTTDDAEREALARVMLKHDPIGAQTHALRLSLADAILAAGFRRAPATEAMDEVDQRLSAMNAWALNAAKDRDAAHAEADALRKALERIVHCSSGYGAAEIASQAIAAHPAASATTTDDRTNSDDRMEDMQPPWRCPRCGDNRTWFDRTEPMATRCSNCGRDVNAGESHPAPQPAREDEALVKRATDAIYLLRNGGNDDPYVVDRPLTIGGDEDDGGTDVNVSDDCAFCTVHANEGQPEIGTAYAIAGAGKLIADLLAAYRAALASPPTAAAGVTEAMVDAAIDCEPVLPDGIFRSGATQLDVERILMRQRLSAALAAAQRTGE